MYEFYNRHYIKTRSDGAITAAWSDGPHPEKDTANAVCINDKGGYQLRLILNGKLTEENPPIYDMDGIPLYKWDGEQVIHRTEEEIEAERVPPLETVRADKLKELSAACNAAITAGCDVALSNGATGHISLTAEDQINLTNACAAVEGGTEAYPYHLDGELCALYPAADILTMGKAAIIHKMYHTTYYNHLAAWVRRCGTVEEARAVTYGADLPWDLAENMTAILTAAGGVDDAV